MELSERLLTQYIAGGWRVPLSTVMRAVPGPPGAAPMALVEAGPADVARACAAADAGARALAAQGAPGRAKLVQAMAAAVEARADLLAQAIMLEFGVSRDAASGDLDAMRRAIAAKPAMPRQVGAGGGKVLLLGAVGARPDLWAGMMAAGLREGCALLIKPAPRAPVLPAMLAAVLHEAQLLPPGALGLIQGGGGVTGAALLAQPGLSGALLLGRAAPRAALATPGLPLVGVPGYEALMPGLRPD